MTDPASSLGLTLAFQACMVGFLAALGLIASLAHRPLREPLLKEAGLYLLASAATGATFSGATEAFLPEHLTGWLDPISLVFAALTFGLWGRLSATMLSDSPSAQRLAPGQRMVAILGLLLAVLALIPYNPSHLLSERLLGILTPTLAALTLVASLQAQREGNKAAPTLALGSVILLICSGSLWAMGLGWVGDAAGMVVLYAALGAQGLLLGWTILKRIRQLHQAAEEAQAAQLANAEWKAAEFEGMVEVRNAQLNARLKDLEEYRRTGEAANEALHRVLTQLEEVSTTDTLTGAWNRRRFEEAAVSQMSLAHRRQEPVSLILMDLDHFKRVNDTYGHSVGDDVLITMAKVARQSLRASDILVRWGGEEFQVLAPGTSQAGAMALAEKLRQSLEAEDFPRVGQVTMSLGVAQYAAGEDLKTWIDRVDQALYAAKDGGRNQSVEALVPAPWAGSDERVRILLQEGWSSGNECGHALMDSQHQRLHLMATALLTLSGERASAAEVQLRLDTLVAHVTQHFHDEEALLRELRYPDIERHSRLHQELLQKAQHLQDEAATGRLEMATLVQFLVLDLVQGHIYNDDRDYFGLIQESDEKG